jgi:hypothetical protein
VKKRHVLDTIVHYTADKYFERGDTTLILVNIDLQKI